MSQPILLQLIEMQPTKIFKFIANDVYVSHFSADNNSAVVDNLWSKFKCPLCSYQTNIATNFKYHILVHTGEKPLVCNQCGKRFRHPTTLKRHEATHISFTK